MERAFAECRASGREPYDTVGIVDGMGTDDSELAGAGKRDMVGCDEVVHESELSPQFYSPGHALRRDHCGDRLTL